ncbi:MAG: hypothetical protein LC798_12060 [Chloroflexi bacterium]|nr:hypothetical protein [Chloroflexota bacterium]
MSPELLRADLHRMVLESPYALARESFDLMSFMRERRFEQYDRLVVGNKTLSDMVGRTKMIDESAWPVTSTEMARPYIRMIWDEQCARPKTRQSKWMGYKRVPWSRETFPMLKINPPQFFEAPSGGDLTYVDIKAAYFQLYSPASLDLRFNPLRGVFGQGIIEFLRTDEMAGLKETRNVVTGVMRATARTQYSSGEWKKVPTYNRFLAPELWGYLMHTLHAIAHEARQRFDVRYIATDGFIVPTSEADLLREFLAEDWGLETTVKCSGPGNVRAMGAYTLGGTGSRSRAERGQPMNNIMDLPDDWREQMRIWRWWLIRREFAIDTRMQLAAADTLGLEEAGADEPFAPDVAFEVPAGLGKPVPTAAAQSAPRLFVSSSARPATLFHAAPGVQRVRLPSAAPAPAGGKLFHAAPGVPRVRVPQQQRLIVARG